VEPAVCVGVVIVLAVVDVVALGDALAAQPSREVGGSEPLFVKVGVEVVKHVEEKAARVPELVLLLLFLRFYLSCVISLELINPLVNRLKIICSNLLLTSVLSTTSLNPGNFADSELELIGFKVSSFVSNRALPSEAKVRAPIIH
jgi:hypothetical protein